MNFLDVLILYIEKKNGILFVLLCVIIIGALSNVALASSMIAILGKIVSSLSLKKKR